MAEVLLFTMFAPFAVAKCLSTADTYGPGFGENAWPAAMKDGEML
ncbi:MAG TPA: hypothetical protein VF033_08265 [Steroidobacteraceae bacterium]|jgi:hypothetical protein